MPHNQFSVKKWLVTGGLGFIGCNLVVSLIERGERQIWVVDQEKEKSVKEHKKFLRVLCEKHRMEFHETNRKIKSSHYKDGKHHLTLIKGDVSDRNIIQQIFPFINTIIHLAATPGVSQSIETPESEFHDNVLGVFEILLGAKNYGVNNIIIASSSATIGASANVINERSHTNPSTPYGVSKMYAENMARVYSNLFGLKAVALRFSNVYGPFSEHKASVVASFIKNILLGEKINIFGDGSVVRDFIYVGDLCSAIIRTADFCHKSKHGTFETLHISSGQGTSINAICELIKTEMGDYSDVVHEPERTGDISYVVAENTKALKLLSWAPEVTLQNGLQKTISWYKKNHA